MDNFFLARTELLQGNEETASPHFLSLKHDIDHYDARARFDFEVQLACELQTSELVNLAMLAVEQKSTIAIPTTQELHPPTGLDTIVSSAHEMREVKRTIERYSSLDLPVLIYGETGTGKELVARALHAASARSHEPFIAINCAAMPDALIESELFGHASGAFTGARTAYKGVFRDAHGGTIFLDEIADIPHRLQVALLRVLETGEVRPVGSSSQYTVSCRVVAATNKELTSLVSKGTFREDLFYRLQRLEIEIPPLRERGEDIPVLMRYFLNQGREFEYVELSQEFIESIVNYSWPGNVRELRNVADRLRVLSSDKNKLRY